jgi:endosialidase-like protein
MDKVSEVLYALKPVSFRYHEQYDATQTIAFGLIAEEVAEVYPDLVGRNHKGEPESVRYEQINAMLLNEFLKAHKIVEEQQATIAQLKKEVATVVARLNEHDSEIQSVSDQVQSNSPDASLAASNR